MLCPVIKRVEDKNTILLSRAYPGICKPVVTKGQSVSDTDIIAHCEISSGQRLIKIAHSLGVSGRDVKKYLTRKIGDRIYEGEIIARKRGSFGFGKQEIKSPIDGQITDVDDRGDLFVKFSPKPIRLLAAGNGTVVDVKEDSIDLSVLATKVKGFVSVGKEREGILTMIAKPNEFIIPSKITADFQGKILVGGVLMEKGALEKAATLGVKGMVVGGVNKRDFDVLKSGGDVGISILVTEGFGNVPMGNDIWELLKSKEGRTCFVSPESSALVIPESGQAEKTASGESTSWRELKVGDNVRIFREESGDLLASVKEILGQQVLNSGILSDVVLIKTSSGDEIMYPAANLEIVE